MWHFVILWAIFWRHRIRLNTSTPILLQHYLKIELVLYWSFAPSSPHIPSPQLWLSSRLFLDMGLVLLQTSAKPIFRNSLTGDRHSAATWQISKQAASNPHLLSSTSATPHIMESDWWLFSCQQVIFDGKGHLPIIFHSLSCIETIRIVLTAWFVIVADGRLSNKISKFCFSIFLPAQKLVDNILALSLSVYKCLPLFASLLLQVNREYKEIADWSTF